VQATKARETTLRDSKMKRSLLFFVFAAAPIATLALASFTVAQPGQRSGAAPCRQGALALIAVLDQDDDKSPDYRHAYSGVVQSCGPAPRKAAVVADRRACRDLALKMLDEIEEGRLNMQGFTQARDAFAASCAPR
jgi:hypothetical protein